MFLVRCRFVSCPDRGMLSAVRTSQFGLVLSTQVLRIRSGCRASLTSSPSPRVRARCSSFREACTPRLEQLVHIPAVPDVPLLRLATGEQFSRMPSSEILVPDFLRSKGDFRDTVFSSLPLDRSYRRRVMKVSLVRLPRRGCALGISTRITVWATNT